MQIRTYYLAFLLRRTFTTFLWYVVSKWFIICRMYEPADVIAMDSHPTRTNGFLTGCVVNALEKIDKSSFHLESLQRCYPMPFNSTISNLDFFRLVNEEMVQESKKARAFRGIECHVNYSPSNQYLWSFPFLASKWKCLLINSCAAGSCPIKLCNTVHKSKGKLKTLLCGYF